MSAVLALVDVIDACTRSPSTTIVRKWLLMHPRSNHASPHNATASGSSWLKWVGPSIGAPASPSPAAESASCTLACPSTSCSASICAGARQGPDTVNSVAKRTARNLSRAAKCGSRVARMATSTFQLGRVGIWTGVLDAVPSAEAQRIAARIEELGFPTLWIPETLGRDPFVTATLLLSATSKLNIATGIANIYARDAVTMANTQRSLEEAFPGRFLLGLGVSHQHLVDRVRHHDSSKPYSYMTSFLEQMDQAIFRAVGPEERPPMVIAALGPKMLELAATKADGAHPYFVRVEHTAEARKIPGPEPILAVEQML